MYNEWHKTRERIKDIPGDLAEFGVYEGDRCFEMAKDFPDRTVWAWDTFHGMPDDNYIESLDNSDPPGKWVPAGDIVEKFRKSGLKIVPVPGKFSETIPTFGGDNVRFAFVHIDCDHYWAYKRVLEFITPRMSPGGVVRLDDYGCCAGAKKATDEWCAATGHTLEEGEMIYF